MTAPSPTVLLDLAERCSAAISSDMNAAKKIKGDVLVWWPIVKTDDDDNLTTEVDGGCWIVSRYENGAWDEPDFLEAIGPFFGDGTCYASEPTHWLPAPPKIKNEIAEAALRARSTDTVRK